jgi:hypothetical protein
MPANGGSITNNGAITDLVFGNNGGTGDVTISNGLTGTVSYMM